jgi:aminocarboxymuconate-semialdehyde decarboxylase
MRIVDSHVHWHPRALFEKFFCKGSGYPRFEKDGKGGYTLLPREGMSQEGPWSEFFELDSLLAHMDSTGHEIDVVCTLGTHAADFSYLEAEEGRDAALEWNEEMAAAQRKYPGRLWASAAVPLVDTRIAIEVLDDAVTRLGLIGANLPSSVGSVGRIDSEKLEPFYDRAEKLGAPLFMHPSDDVVFESALDGYNGALYMSLGRVVDVSVALMRLVLSGIMERHPGLKVVTSHTGGALPYQAGRMDKNTKAAKLPRPASTYLRRMYSDTVSPHGMGIKFAVEFYGADQVMYGSDYPCWNPRAAMAALADAGISKADQEKILSLNARRILNLKSPVLAPVSEGAL